MKSTKLLFTLTIVALALTSCGGNDVAQEQPDQDAAEQIEVQEPAEQTEQPVGDNLDTLEGMGPMPAGEFELYGSEGGHMVFDLPTDPSHESVAAIDEYREEVGMDPVTYIVVDADAREGSQMIKMPALTVYDEEGNAYEFEGLDWALDEWGPERSWEDDEDYWLPDGTPIDASQYREYEERHNELLDSLESSVSPAGRGELILVYPGDDLPDEFTRVAGLPYGLGYEEDAYPTDY